MYKIKLKVPIEGVGTKDFPFIPKYSDDEGILGFDKSQYDLEENVCIAVFKSKDKEILDSIMEEEDVKVIEQRL